MTGGHRPLVAGIDVGTTHTKIALWTARAEPCAIAVRTTPYTRDATGARAVDVGRLVALTHEGLGQLARTAGRAPESIGVASMAETGVPLGDDLQPLTPAVPWTDRRADGDLDALVRRWSRDELYRRTGLPAEAKHTLATWLWTRRRRR